MQPQTIDPTTGEPLTPEQFAEQLAKQDAALMERLQQRSKKRLSELREGQERGALDEDFVVTEEPTRIPMNRAQRREQVKLYAKVLAASERQTPVVNPTIIPKSSRRRRKGGRRA